MPLRVTCGNCKVNTGLICGTDQDIFRLYQFMVGHHGHSGIESHYF